MLKLYFIVIGITRRDLVEGYIYEGDIAIAFISIT